MSNAIDQTVDALADFIETVPLSQDDVHVFRLQRRHAERIAEALASRDAVRYGVFCYGDGSWYVSDPPDLASAKHNADLLRDQGEACDVWDESTGRAMQNAVAWARSLCA